MIIGNLLDQYIGVIIHISRVENICPVRKCFAITCCDNPFVSSFWTVQKMTMPSWCEASVYGRSNLVSKGVTKRDRVLNRGEQNEQKRSYNVRYRPIYSYFFNWLTWNLAWSLTGWIHPVIFLIALIEPFNQILWFFDLEVISLTKAMSTDL